LELKSRIISVQKVLLKYFNLLRVIIVILMGIVLSVFVIYVMSKNPGASVKSFLLGPFLSSRRLGNVFENATPILLCGLAAAVPFQAGQFFLGGEGSMLLSASIGTAFAVSTNMPMFVHIPLVLLVSALAGAFWGFIPGILKAKANANEIVVTLLLNYVGFYLALYLINFHFRDTTAGFMVSYELPKTAWFPQFIPGTRVHWGILLAFAAVFIVFYFLYHTTTGYEIRMTGFNKNFARYGGVSIIKIVILSQVIGGLISGVAGITEIMGIYRKYKWQISPGYGWDGVIVAIIGRNHPILIIFAALFLAYLRVGGQILNLMSDIPAEMVKIVQAIIIMLITAEAFLEQWKYRVTVKQAAMDESAT
jgi:simple sugar transport system permease protein